MFREIYDCSSLTQYRAHAMSKLATSTFAWPQYYTIWSGADLTMMLYVKYYHISEETDFFKFM